MHAGVDGGCGALRLGSIVFFFWSLMFFWRSPESSDLWYNSRRLKRRRGPILSAGGNAGVTEVHAGVDGRGGSQNAQGRA